MREPDERRKMSILVTMLSPRLARGPILPEGRKCLLIRFYGTARWTCGPVMSYLRRRALRRS